MGLDLRKNLIQMLALWLVVAVGMPFLFKLNLFIVLFISFISRMKFYLKEINWPDHKEVRTTETSVQLKLDEVLKILGDC